MLNRRAIREFLDQPCENHNWLKDLDEADVDAAMAALRPRPDIKKPLRLHQKVCFLLGVAYPEFFFMLDMGTGKTRISLELLRYFIQNGILNKCMVCAPTDEILAGWCDEVAKWVPDLKFAFMEGSSKEKWAAFNSVHRGVVGVTYIGLVHMVSQHVVVKKRTKDGTLELKGQLQPNKKWIDAIKKQIDGYVADESTALGNSGSLYYRVGLAVSSLAKVRYALAGRPVGRDPTLLWSQFDVLDRGDTLGETLGFFREVFFTKKKSQWSRSQYAFQYTMDARMAEDLQRRIGTKSITYSSDECLDLPELVPVVRRLHLPQEAEAFYDRVVAELISAKGNMEMIKNSFVRLRQISSGFLAFKDDETGERAEYEFEHNVKLEELMEVIEEIPLDRKAVVFHEFTYSGERICAELKKRKIKHGWVYGGTKDYQALKARFDTDPTMRVMVVNHRKGAMGLNMQAANYSLFYESPVGVIMRDQAERRTLRDGQLHAVFQYDFVMADTADERILEFHKEGRDIYEALVADPRRFLRRVSKPRRV